MQAQQALDLRHHWNSVDLAQRCAPYDQQPGLHDQDESSVLDDNAEKNSCIVADSCRKHQTTHRGALLSLDGTPVLFDRRALTSSDTKARRTTRDRMIRRMAYVASTPVCLYTMGCYLASHELAAEGGESPSEWERHMPQLLATSPTSLTNPHPLVFSAACTSTVLLMVSYYRLNLRDAHQSWIVAMCFLTSIFIAVSRDQALLTTAVVLVPWAVFVGLMLSDAVHAILRWRRPQPDLGCLCDEKQRLCGSGEV